MDQAIHIKSKFDDKSHHGSFSAHLWHRWRRWLVLRRFVCIAMIMIGGYMAMRSYGSQDRFANFVTISFILLGSVGLMRPMIWQMWSERKLRKHPAFGTEIEYVFNHDEVNINGESGDVVVPWCALCEVVETNKGMLLYQSRKDYVWIPSRDFSKGEMSKIVKFHQDSLEH